MYSTDYAPNVKIDVGLQISIIRKLEAVLGYKLQKESNCPTSCRQYPFKSDTRKRCHFSCPNLAGP